MMRAILISLCIALMILILKNSNLNSNNYALTAKEQTRNKKDEKKSFFSENKRSDERIHKFWFVSFTSKSGRTRTEAGEGIHSGSFQYEYLDDDTLTEDLKLAFEKQNWTGVFENWRDGKYHDYGTLFGESASILDLFYFANVPLELLDEIYRVGIHSSELSLKMAVRKRFQEDYKEIFKYSGLEPSSKLNLQDDSGNQDFQLSIAEFALYEGNLSAYKYFESLGAEVNFSELPTFVKNKISRELSTFEDQKFASYLSSELVSPEIDKEEVEARESKPASTYLKVKDWYVPKKINYEIISYDMHELSDVSALISSKDLFKNELAKYIQSLSISGERNISAKEALDFFRFDTIPKERSITVGNSSNPSLYLLEFALLSSVNKDYISELIQLDFSYRLPFIASLLASPESEYYYKLLKEADFYFFRSDSKKKSLSYYMAISSDNLAFERFRKKGYFSCDEDGYNSTDILILKNFEENFSESIAANEHAGCSPNLERKSKIAIY